MASREHPLFADNVESATSGAITDIDTTISVIDASVFPTPNASASPVPTVVYLTLDDTAGVTEVVKCTAIVGNDLTVVRGVGSSPAVAWVDASSISLRIPSIVLDDVVRSLVPGTIGIGSESVNIQPSRTVDANIASGSQSVAIGSNTLAGQDSVVIGYKAQDIVGNSQNVIIGAGAYTTGTCSDNVTIGPEGYAYNSIKSVSMGGGAGCHNSDWTVVMGRWAWSWDSGQSISLGGKAYCDYSVRGIAIGYSSETANSLQSIVIGNEGRSYETNRCVSIGSHVYTQYSDDSVGIGYQSFCGYSDNAVCIGRGTKTYKSDSSVTLGHLTYTNEATQGIGIGKSVTIQGNYSIGIGSDASTRVDKSYRLNATNIISRSDTPTDLMRYYAGHEAVVFSRHVDLKTVAADVGLITLPAGCKFFPVECGIIIVTSSAATVAPTVEFGITGDSDNLVAPVQIGSVVIDTHQIFSTAHNNGVTSLTAGVTVAATATALEGRIYWKGLLIEDKS